jgi:cytochrome oxidase Cu insertion factor (SCO1/SenC/PrrC family)
MSSVHRVASPSAACTRRPSWLRLVELLAVLLFTAAAALGETAPPSFNLVDQDGRKVDFYRDLIGPRRAAVNLIFTTCRGVCPLLGANFAAVARELAKRGAHDVALVSISVDPEHDTPERLAAWRRERGGPPSWTLVTGSRRDVDRLLAHLGMASLRKEAHSPLMLVGGRDGWSRLDGLAAPETVADHLAPAAAPTPAEHYFTNTILRSQRGEDVRFYADLVRGRTVVITSFFASCKASCTLLNAVFAHLQQHFGDRLGRDVVLVSITVDPEHDTPEVLARTAAANGAGGGWYFLSGDPAAVRTVLAKLGLSAETPERHSNLILVGNDRTGLWKKVFGLANPQEVVKSVDSVVNDERKTTE